MIQKHLTINYTEYGSASEMEPEDRALIDQAILAQNGSYSPYSHFRVGAAVRMEDGTIVRGSNQENNA